MVQLPSITLNCGSNYSLANVHIAHKLEESMLKTSKLMGFYIHTQEIKIIIAA